MARIYSRFLIVTLTALCCACGGEEKPVKEAPVVANPESAIEAGTAQEGSGDSPAAVKPKAQPAYAVPVALSPEESRSEYGVKRIKKAKRLNSAGYNARKKDDAEAAIEKYRAAVELAPGYVQARFNLACEFARAGMADEAVGELEHLFRMGTQEALGKIAKLQVDTDFDPIRSDPRIQVITSLFQVDFDQPIFKQLCANQGKMIALMDKRGLYSLTIKSNEEYMQVYSSKKIKGGKARTVVSEILDTVCEDGRFRRQDFECEGNCAMLSDTVLSKWTAKYPKRCVPINGVLFQKDQDQDMDPQPPNWSGHVCFVRQGQEWIIGAAGLGITGERDSELQPGLDKAVAKAVREWGS